MKSCAKSLIRAIRNTVGDTPRVGAEIGVWKGEMSRVLLETFPDLLLLCVDPWEFAPTNPTMKTSQTIAAQARLEFESSLVSLYYPRCTQCWMTSLEAAKKCVASHSLLDFVYIDGNHTYPSVRDDIALWWPLVAPKGILAGHDYPRGNSDRRGWGVKKAVDQWVAANSLELHVSPGLVWWVQKL